MKIVDFGYLIPSIIILLGIPLLFYIKLVTHSTKSLDVTIYGSTIQTALLAYYIDKNIQKVFGNQNKKYLNLTIISPWDPPSLQRLPKQTDKNLLTFCGIQNHLISLLNDLDMQFSINQYGIYFSSLQQVEKKSQANLQTYKIQQEYPIKSLLEYGLSHITAKNIFQQFEWHLSQYSKSRQFEQMRYDSLDELSMASSVYHLFPYKFAQSGIVYLSEIIGLDQQYIHDYIMPVIWGSYLHEPNSITSMLKLLPLYCTRNKQIGSSLAILVDETQLYKKLISKIKYINVNHVYNHHLQGFQLLLQRNYNDQSSIQLIQTRNDHIKPSNNNNFNKFQIQVTYLNTFINQTRQKQQQDRQIQQKQDQLTYQKLRTNLLFIIQDYQMANKKQISYYKTIVDGKIKNDQNYQQYFTLYFTYQKQKQSNQAEKQQSKNKKNQYIYSATRLCKQNCKNFNKNVYLLISKQKLSQKDLGMFQQHHIVYYKKYWLPKTQLPSKDKFQQIENVYRVYDTESVSDSYEFKLTVLDELSHTVIKKMIQK